MAEENNKAGDVDMSTGPAKVEGDKSEESLKVGEHQFRNVDELKEAYLSLDRAIGTQGQELGELRKIVKATSSAEKVEEDPAFFEKFETVIYSDPKEAAKMIDKRVESKARKMVEAERSRIVEMSLAEKAEDALFDEFFGKFPKWSGSKRFVKDVTKAILMPRLDQIQAKDAQFAEIDRYLTENLGDIDEAAGSRPLGSRKPAFESGGAPSGASSRKSEEPAKAKTLVDQLQESGYSKTV